MTTGDEQRTMSKFSYRKGILPENSIEIFLKGLLMGVCDIIPGISGGTIAFTTGIYERLLHAVKSFSPKVVKDVALWVTNRNATHTQELIKDFRQMDVGFLSVLFLGISIALMLMSHIVGYLLEHYFAYLMAFFIGLILSSSKILFDHIVNHKKENILFGFMGIACGLSLLLFVPAIVNPSPLYLFMSGFLAISAMFLPGISGAFILLILGVYEHLVLALHDVVGNIRDIFFFILGAILGAFTISRLILFLFSRYRCETLYLLLGLVLGSLSIPLQQIFKEAHSFSLLELTGALVLFGVGVLSVSIVQKIHARQKNPQI